MTSDFETRLKKLITEEDLKQNEPMSRHTTFKIGGPADYFAIPDSIDTLKNLILLCREEKVSYYVIGNGSNLLVGDKGYRGVIIQIGRHFEHILTDGRRIKAGAGVLLSRLASYIAEESLTGFEFASGIPGNLGGAVTMNAGAYGSEMKNYLQSVSVMDQDGEIHELQKNEMEFGYRTSIMAKMNYIVLEAVFELEEGNKKEIIDRMNELNRQRREKQPLQYASAGSTFKRPEGYFAGKLIMDAGLRGYRVGNMMISDKHCGFVINTGQGTAADAVRLIRDTDRIVYEHSGVHLEPEVRFLGEF